MHYTECCEIVFSVHLTPRKLLKKLSIEQFHRLIQVRYRTSAKRLSSISQFLTFAATIILMNSERFWNNPVKYFPIIRYHHHDMAPLVELGKFVLRVGRQHSLG